MTTFMALAKKHQLPLDIHICDDKGYSAIEKSSQLVSPATQDLPAITGEALKGFGVPLQMVQRTSDYDPKSVSTDAGPRLFHLDISRTREQERASKTSVTSWDAVVVAKVEKTTVNRGRAA